MSKIKSNPPSPTERSGHMHSTLSAEDSGGENAAGKLSVLSPPADQPPSSADSRLLPTAIAQLPVPSQTEALKRLTDALTSFCQPLNSPVGLPSAESLDTKDVLRPLDSLDEILWETLTAFQNYSFQTAKNLEFSYILKGYEMFVSRKDKSITKSTVLLSFHKALEVQERDGRVSGPKKLGTFGASYLYPIFLHLGIITKA